MKRAENEFYVYEHIRLDDMTCFYVGKGCKNRAFTNGRNEYHDRVAKKYGYIISIFKDKLTEEESHYLEKELIEDYVFNLGYSIAINKYREKSSMGNLTNQTWGGDGSVGYRHSYKSKIIMSNLLKGRIVSEETRDKLRESAKNRPIISEETREKLRESSKKENLSEYTRKLLSEGQIGSKNHSAKSVICLNSGNIYETVKKASLENNCDNSGIVKCCKGLMAHCGKSIADNRGLEWAYLSDYNNNTIKKYSKKSKPVICTTTNIVFKNYKEACDFYNCSNHIRECCENIRKFCGKNHLTGEKLKWEYYISEES